MVKPVKGKHYVDLNARFSDVSNIVFIAKIIDVGFSSDFKYELVYLVVAHDCENP